MPRRPSTRGPEPVQQVHRISSAPHSHSDDLSERMARYLISMAIRTVCVVLVVVVSGPLRWVFAVGAIGLPYVAVVMANASRRPRDPAVAAPGDRPTAALNGEPPVFDAQPPVFAGPEQGFPEPVVTPAVSPAATRVVIPSSGRRDAGLPMPDTL